MSYAPTTDFLALLRNTSGGARLESMPGLDYVVAAMARMNLFRVWVAASAPLTNQSSTVWLSPAQPSWSAEGIVMLWNGLTLQFEPATPALWFALLSQSSAPYIFQSVTTGTDIIASNTTLLAIQRAAPSSTLLTLPSIGGRNGRALQIVDFSTAVVDHSIVLTPVEPTATVMRLSSWQLRSITDQLSGVTLYPSTDLNAWVIAP